jgi:uncharacterized protein
VMNLLMLSHLIENERWSDEIDRTLRFFGGRLEQVGRAVPMMAAALSMYTAGPQQIVIVGTAGAEALERAVTIRYLPFATMLALTPEQQAALAPVAAFVGSMRPVEGLAAAYVCRNFACRQPVTSVAALEDELGGSR